MKPSNIATLSLLPAALVLSSFASADAYKHITEVIDASALEAVKIDISVAELDIEAWDESYIQLEIDIESQRNWLSWRRKDVEDIELEIDTSGSRVYLAITEDDIEQDWRVKLPASLALELEMGVGDIKLDNFANHLELDLGVGAVRVETRDVDFESIHASAGVGDASIRGYNSRADNERSFISADASYLGGGEYVMNIEVGVGDVQVRNN